MARRSPATPRYLGLEVAMRCLFGFICVLALGVIGCSETAGTGGSSGVGGDGGSAGMGGGGAGGFGGAGETATLQVRSTRTVSR